MDRRSAPPAACQESRYAKNTAERVPACDNLSVTERPQTLGEEIANSVSHGIALVVALVAAPFLVAEASLHGAASIVAAVIFALTMALLYSASVLYHALPRGRAKRIFRTLDHGAIYLFIAGSYTPFALGALAGPWGWTLFGLVWSLALLGITLKAFDRLSHPGLSTGLYLLMGWLVLIAAVPLAEHVPSRGVALLVAGGLAYTLGVVLFKLDSRWRYAHAVWHGFVVVGSGCHFIAVLQYAA
jgi:hemolysin III